MSLIDQLRIDILGYKRAKFLVTQSGTNAPDAVQFINETGDTFTFSRYGEGVYKIEKSTAWDVNKTFVPAMTMGVYGGVADMLGRIDVGFEGADLFIYTYDSAGAPCDGQMVCAPLEIQIFP